MTPGLQSLTVQRQKSPDKLPHPPPKTFLNLFTTLIYLSLDLNNRLREITRLLPPEIRPAYISRQPFRRFSFSFAAGSAGGARDCAAATVVPVVAKIRRILLQSYKQDIRIFQTSFYFS